jgi:hypothetical protein
MGSADTPHWNLLERWSPTLFLMAGGVLVIYATFNGLLAFTDMVPEQHGLEVGYVPGFLGLLGLYPTLADRSPWLARVGVVAAVCGIVSITFISASDLAQLAGVTADRLPGFGVARFLPLVGFILGYLSFGAASLRSGVYSPSVGLVLLIPGVIVVLMLAHIAAGFASDLTAFVISAGEAMAHLAIGATLRTQPGGDADEPATTGTDDESLREGDVELTTDD